jgi:hypothetical protein
MNSKTLLSTADVFRTFGFVIIRQFFDAASLGEEIDQVMRSGVASRQPTAYSGIHFQYVPMMTAETPESLALLDRAGALAEAVLGGPVLPTRAKGTRYFGNTPWHTDSDSPVTSIGFLAYCDPLDADTGALRVIPGSGKNGSRRLRLIGETVRPQMLESIDECSAQPQDLPRRCR